MRRCLQFCKVPYSILNVLAPYTFEDAKQAVLKSDIDLLTKILQSGIYIPLEEDNLIIVALNAQKEDIALFLIKEFDYLFQFDRRSERGDSLLMIAIFKQMHKAIRVLVQKCDLNACDFRRNTAFIAAAANGDLETLQLLSKQPSCKLLVRNDQGQSALHRACFFGQMEAVDWLLRHTELKLGEKDNKGNNSLHLACQRVNLRLTRYIMKKVRNSKKLLIPNCEGKMPLDLLTEALETLPINERGHLQTFHLKPHH